MPARASTTALIRTLLASRWLRVGFVIAVLVGAASYLHDQWDKIGPAFDKLSALTVAEALVAVLVGLVGSMLAYRSLLADLGSRLPVPVAARIFFVGQLGKYIPGSLWPVVAQMEMGRDAGVPRQRSAAAITLTILIYLGAGILLGAVALPFGSEGAGGYRFLVLLAPVLLLALHPRVVNPLFFWICRVANRPAPERPFSAAGVLQAFGWSVFSWLAFGAQVALVAHDLGASEWRTVPLSVGGFALAWSAGFLVVFAPAGLGAREVVLAALLGSLFATQGGPAAVSFAARALMTAGDVLTAGLAALAWRRGQKTQARRVNQSHPNGVSSTP